MPRTAHPCLRARNSSPQGGGTGTEVTPAHHAANTAAISRQKRQQCHSANRNNATAKTATAGDGSQQQTAGISPQVTWDRKQGVNRPRKQQQAGEVTWGKGVNHPRKQQQQAENFAASYAKLGQYAVRCRAVRCRLVPLRAGDRTTPGRIRTCDLRFRKPLLYPTELRGQLGESSS
jgi:hypothetical protein